MKLSFDFLPKDVILSAGEIADMLGIGISDTGIPLKYDSSYNGLKIIASQNEILISTYKKNLFFRALGIIKEKMHEENEFEIFETESFPFLGTMLDMSRNAVMNINNVKKYIRFSAVMGYNSMMLYTEDTYEIKKYPYFGYMRGRYTKDELKELDSYAASFGIELIPHIQVLAHLNMIFRWNYTADFHDCDDILLAGEEKTYDFIEEMLKTVSECFTSKRIHIGMDEAFSLGRGKYLTKNGYLQSDEIFKKHIEIVMKIVSKYGFSPMIYSDMFIKEGINVKIPELEEKPQLVYWEYTNEDEKVYFDIIKKHIKSGYIPYFAGTSWLHLRACQDQRKAIKTSIAGINAAKKNSLPGIYITTWGDGGFEAAWDTILLSMQLYAEYNFYDNPSVEYIQKRVENCTGIPSKLLWAIAQMDELKETQLPYKQINREINPSSSLLWQDILVGLLDKTYSGINWEKHYTLCSEKLSLVETTGEYQLLKDRYLCLSKVLEIKSTIGMKIRKAYNSDDKMALKEIIENILPELSRRIKKLKNTHRELWMDNNKPFGWDVFDLQYGFLISRIETAIERLGLYISGDILKLDELEEEILYFYEEDNSLPLSNIEFLWTSGFSQISTASRKW